MQATCLCWLDPYQRDENSWQQILRSPSSAPHLVAIYIFVFLYSWVRNSSLRDAIWKCKEWEVSPKRITDQTVEQWKCCSMKISYQHSRPHSEALHLKYVSCICNWAQCFLLWAVKQNWEENLENHSFLIFFFQFNYFLIHELDRNYGTIYKLPITWNAICVIGRISHIYSLRPNNSKTIKEVSVLSHQPCQWDSPGDHSQMCFHMTFILQIYFLAKKYVRKIHLLICQWKAHKRRSDTIKEKLLLS